jgi:alcohol dehydrogenase class IV
VESAVEEAARSFSEGGCDSVIGLGGGSALDVAKAVRLRIRAPDRTLRQFDFDADWSGLVPFVAIPTTAGTGSEVGRSSVIILDGRKTVIFHPAR